MKPEYIVIHHSLTEDDKTVSWGAIRRYHMNTLKWHDIGYHYGVELVGDNYEILKGRMDDEVGAHCLGFNDRSLGVCVVGNFDNQAPNEEQIAILARLVKSLMAVHGIPPEHVIGHWESYGMLNRRVEKSCPGNRFSMKNFREVL